MDKRLLEELIEEKYSYETAHVCFFNNGKVRTEDNGSAKRINNSNPRSSLEDIKDVLKRAIRFYSSECDFDTINLDLELGIVYDKNDVNEDNTIKENCEPIQNIVRFYTGSIKCLLNEEEASKFNYGEIGYGYQSYTKFDELKSLIDKNGLSYNGPQTFEELKDRIQSGEKFNITVSANLVEKEKQVQKQEVKETPKRKKLFFK